MKTITKSIAVLSIAILTSCGMSAEEKTKKIEEAATLRAKQFCENADGTNNLAVYGEKMTHLMEQLGESGITAPEDANAATAAYDKKIKESCPDKFPK